MEITDQGTESPIEIIELDGPPDGLEISDLIEGMGQDQIVLPGAGPVALPTVEEEESEEKPTDWENDGDHRHFMVYIKNRMNNIPRHSGNTTVGCEKAIAFLKRLDREISKAVQSDEDNVISEEEAESIRDQIIEFVHQLEEAHETLRSTKRQHKKSSVKVGKEVVARLGDGENFKYYLPVVKDGEEELLEVSIAEPDDETVQKFVEGEVVREGLTKEGSTGQIVIYVDPFMQSLSRLLIDGHVSGGHNMNEMMKKFTKKYKLTDREKLALQEILLQKNFPMYKDFGLDGEYADPTQETGIEFSAGYPA